MIIMVKQFNMLKIITTPTKVTTINTRMTVATLTTRMKMVITVILNAQSHHYWYVNDSYKYCYEDNNHN